MSARMNRLSTGPTRFGSDLWLYIAGMIFRTTPPGNTNVHSIAPASIAETKGKQYFKQVVITWSMRKRGSVQRRHIINVTPGVGLDQHVAQAQQIGDCGHDNNAYFRLHVK